MDLYLFRKPHFEWLRPSENQATVKFGSSPLQVNTAHDCGVACAPQACSRPIPRQVLALSAAHSVVALLTNAAKWGGSEKGRLCWHLPGTITAAACHDYLVTMKSCYAGWDVFHPMFSCLYQVIRRNGGDSGVVFEF